jgi:hypothetical protein
VVVRDDVSVAVEYDSGSFSFDWDDAVAEVACDADAVDGDDACAESFYCFGYLVFEG